MTTWQRIGLLILSCFAIMVLYPDFGSNGWMFIGVTLGVGLGVIMLVALISDLFAIYRFEWLTRLISLVMLVCLIYVLLHHFPQRGNLSPWQQLQAGQRPTQDDINRGIRRLTFNFDFVHRNVRRDENFVNQEIERPQKLAEPKPTTRRQHSDPFGSDLDIVVSDEEQ